jgi:transcriptional regulator with XRE-family HTH domain
MCKNTSKQPERKNTTDSLITFDEISKIFGERVKEERKKIKMTQAKLAEYVGISEDTVKRIEKGKGERLDVAFIISKKLGVPLQSLLPQENKSEIDIAERIQNAEETLHLLKEMYVKSQK